MHSVIILIASNCQHEMLSFFIIILIICIHQNTETSDIA